MPKSKVDKSVFACCRDFNGRTCIRFVEQDGITKFVPMNVEEGLELIELPTPTFKKQYQVMDDYPVKRGCQLFLSYALRIGASTEVLDWFKQIIKIQKEDYDMATAKAKARKTVAKKKSPAKKKAAVKKSTAKKTVAKKSPAKKTVAKKGKTGRFSSAAQMFQDLIMRGTMTDDKIFEKVQEEFGLDENKRSYVKWYRNHLVKKGENPPPAK